MMSLMMIPADPPLLQPGVQWVVGGAWFLVHSTQAVAVDLCLYDSQNPERESLRMRMARTELDLWAAFVPEAQPGLLYGYRAHGPWRPQDALRFNPQKLLLDPYARAIVGGYQADARMCSPSGPNHLPGCLDSAVGGLRSVAVRGEFDWSGHQRPGHPWQDTVIYELHVRGYTQLHPQVPEHLRGTYAGLAHPVVIEHLKKLGITAVQLMPVHYHIDDGFLIGRGLTNYWGYSTLGYFAPHAEYAFAQTPEDQLREFKGMVKLLHAAGIEVILDVVYNHTAEGNENGPMLSFRGLDDAAYYHHEQHDGQLYYANMTGCGHVTNTGSAPTLRLVMDSLRYWATEMQVDGFRFDLAVSVARDEQGNYQQASPFLSAISQDPVLSKLKLIAEPWDMMKMDSYQVGGFPQPWRELNGKYRDSVRRFWSGVQGSTAEFAKRLCGSQDIYGHNAGRPALSSVNFITSHDGFTLLDLVSYSSKHNEANGEDNMDGDSQNHSISCGAEGPTDDPRVLQLRARLRRSMLATLMTSVGVPFVTAGDELGRTQHGNNNAYCQDNEISWVDWSQADAEMLDFTQRVIALRKAHPELRRRQFFDGQIDPSTGLADVTWLDGTGGLLCHEEWHDPERKIFGAVLRCQLPWLFLFNQGELPQLFHLPTGRDVHWRLIYDTGDSPPFADRQTALIPGGDKFTLNGSTVVCLQLAAGKLKLPQSC
jgi:isoamylase